MLFLAQAAADAAAQTVAAAPPPPPPVADASSWSLISHWPGETDLISWCQQMGPGCAALLIMGGIVYLLFGFQIFKALVLANAAMVGAWVGSMIGRHGDEALAGGILGAFAAAALAWPTMKYAVALMGGVFGVVLGASVWRTVNLDPQLCWAGALIGLVAFGLLSFVLFRGSIMMYTSLQGAFMLVFGILGLIYKYHDLAPTVSSHLTLKPFLLPSSIFIPAVIGLIFQQHNTAAPPPAAKK